MSNTITTRKEPDATAIWYLVARVVQDPDVRRAWREAGNGLRIAGDSPTSTVYSVMTACTKIADSWARHSRVAPVTLLRD